jgi:hypothetical protein
MQLLKESNQAADLGGSAVECADSLWLIKHWHRKFEDRLGNEWVTAFLNFPVSLKASGMTVRHTREMSEVVHVIKYHNMKVYKGEHAKLYLFLT